jgi:hypothetical protein
MIKNFLMAMCAGLLACGIFLGCARKSAEGSQAFGHAAPEIKQVWDKAVADDKANDYVAAVTGYHSLLVLRANLTADQLTAVNDAALAINQRLYTAANSGDAAAKAASMKLAGMQNQH